jgi:hypothetical protein
MRRAWRAMPLLDNSRRHSPDRVFALHASLHKALPLPVLADNSGKHSMPFPVNPPQRSLAPTQSGSRRGRDGSARSVSRVEHRGEGYFDKNARSFTNAVQNDEKRPSYTDLPRKLSGFAATCPSCPNASRGCPLTRTNAPAYNFPPTNLIFYILLTYHPVFFR